MQSSRDRHPRKITLIGNDFFAELSLLGGTESVRGLNFIIAASASLPCLAARVWRPVS